MNKKVLVLFAHPSQRRSEVNVPLFYMAQSVPGVTAVDLYAEYPTYQIDIDKEQQRLQENDIIIFQYPMYWYSTPSILKEWQDRVLEYGFAYGQEGNALYGKYFMCAITAGGKEEAYKAEGYNHYKIRQLLSPLEQMANRTGMIFLSPFCLFGARLAVEENKMDKHAEAYYKLLTAFVTDKVQMDLFTTFEKVTSSTLHGVLK